MIFAGIAFLLAMIMLIIHTLYEYDERGQRMRTILEYKAHETRLLTERNELELKLTKLNDFIKSDKFADVHFTEQQLMGAQRSHMLGYLTVLKERINLICTS